MPSLLLDQDAWDLLIDARGNIAVAGEPYALAQDAACAIKTFLGEVYFDTTLGVPYLSEILAKRPSITLLKSELESAATSMPGVGSAKCFLVELSRRRMGGQIQVTSATTQDTSAATFAVVNPQGVG